MTLWVLILNLCKCQIRRSLWIAWSTRMWKICDWFMAHVIMWLIETSCKSALRQSVRFLLLAWLRQGFVISDLSKVPGLGQHIKFKKVQDISKLVFFKQFGFVRTPESPEWYKCISSCFGHCLVMEGCQVAYIWLLPGNVPLLFLVWPFLFSIFFTKSSAGKQMCYSSAFAINMDIKLC